MGKGSHNIDETFGWSRFYFTKLGGRVLTWEDSIHQLPFASTSIPILSLRTTPLLTFHHVSGLEAISAPQKFDIQEYGALELGDWETAW